MAKVRMADIAQAAGVGQATVERVLNARGNVSPATAEKVVVAARRLGYRGELPERYRGVVQIEVIMTRPDTPFFRRLNQAFAHIASTLDHGVVMHRTFLPEGDAGAVARHVSRPGFRRSGLVVVAPSHPATRERLRELRDAGTHVVHVVSRVDEEAPFVGIDNRAAGRSAGFFMEGLTRGFGGTVAAVCNGAPYWVHRERIRGFSDFTAASGAGRLAFTRVLFGGDDPVRTAEVVGDAVKADARLTGIYNAGGANDGVGAVLEATARSGRRITWIGHELTEETRGFLRSGLMDIVFDQSPETQARKAVDILLERIGFLRGPVSLDPVPFITYTPENV